MMTQTGSWEPDICAECLAKRNKCKECGKIIYQETNNGGSIGKYFPNMSPHETQKINDVFGKHSGDTASWRN